MPSLDGVPFDHVIFSIFRIMKFALIFCLLAVATSMAQRQSVAVFPSIADPDTILSQRQSEMLADIIRNIALKTLPANDFNLLTRDVVDNRLGGPEAVFNACKEGTCIGELTAKIQADFGARCEIFHDGGKLWLKFELYGTLRGDRNPGIIDLIPGEEVKDFKTMQKVLEKRVPEAFKKIIPYTPFAPSIQGGISGVQSNAGGAIDVGKRYLANFTTEPAGAILSFNGMPVSSCAKTPCNVELGSGNIRIIAALDHYETTDTTISLVRNNQDVSIKLKPKFGILEIKPAYSGGLGKDETWNLSIDGKSATSLENRLSPNKYKVKLSHKCYEDISFDVGINKGSREIFDMTEHINLKQSGLVLSAEKDGKPVSEPVFANGKQIGETPFSGSVAVCSNIEVGKDKEKAEIKLEYKQTIRYTHKIGTSNIFVDKRDGRKYRTTKIGTQIWMAENLNYKLGFFSIGESICHNNNPENCAKNGRKYNRAAAVRVCPKGWHLPSFNEWETLIKFADCNETELNYYNCAHKFMAKEWLFNTDAYERHVETVISNGKFHGTNEYGFSALPNNNTSWGDIASWWTSGYSTYNKKYYYFVLGFDRFGRDYFSLNSSTEHTSSYTYNSIRCIKD